MERLDMSNNFMVRRVALAGNDTIERLMRGVPTPRFKDQIFETEYQTHSIETLHHFLRYYANEYGEPFGYRKEQYGYLIQDIFPQADSASEQISSSFDVELEMHTEIAFHDFRPDYVLLFCVRGDANAITYISDIDDFYESLPQDCLNELAKPQFYTYPDISFSVERKVKPIGPFSIINMDSRTIRFDSNLTFSETSAATDSIKVLKELISKTRHSITLSTGDYLAIDNSKCIHGRAPYQPKFDGSDRWLKRMFVKKRPLMPINSMVKVDNHYVVETNYS
jgi:hypothetical protein